MNRGGMGLALLFVAVVATTTGCASWKAISQAPGPWGAAEQPTAPAEYDVLVGQLFELEGKLGEASAAYGRALAKDPDSIYLLKKIAELAARQNQLGRAIVHGERAPATQWLHGQIGRHDAGHSLLAGRPVPTCRHGRRTPAL